MSGPETATVWFGGRPFRFDSETCRRALAARQADGEFEDVAKPIDKLPG